MKVLWLAACLGVGCTIDARISPDEPDVPEYKPWGVPYTGGTMTVTRDGARAIVADPDRDRVLVVNLAERSVVQRIDLPAQSEPGRVIEDDAGRIHVALRRSGQLLTLTGSDQQLRPICGEPRGLAAQGEIVHVACATGELVTVPAGGGDPVRTLRLERDLRDVIARADGGLTVTTFRTATLLTLDAQGAIVSRAQPPTVKRTEMPGSEPLLAVGDVHDAVPAVAWRTIALSDGRLLMSHQRRTAMTLGTSSGGYGGGCGAQPVESSLTTVGTDGTPIAVEPATDGSLPIDVAENPVTHEVAALTAGNAITWLVSPAQLATPDDDDDECDVPTARMPIFDPGNPLAPTTAVAYATDGSLLLFQPDAAHIAIYRTGSFSYIELGDPTSGDPARTLFHFETGAGLACASCHPEGRDDGGVWTFDIGIRRTQNLGGGILERAPYHWGADMPTLQALLADVFAARMRGPAPTTDDERALGPWLDRVPAPHGVVSDPAAVARGQALFDAPEVGCRSCHTGNLLTNNKLADVGKAGMLKVPSLIGVGGRAPFMHDGCAATLRDRFGVCGGGDNHGHTSQLTPAEIDDLVAYLDSL